MLPQNIDTNEIGENTKFALANLHDIKRVLGGKKLDRNILGAHLRRDNKNTDFLLKINEIGQTMAARQPSPLDRMLDEDTNYQNKM